MPWICEDCNTNNEDSALECCVCGSSKASSAERASKRVAAEEKKLREAREASEWEKKARDAAERKKKAKEETERIFREREARRRTKETHEIMERELAEKDAAVRRAERGASTRTETRESKLVKLVYKIIVIWTLLKRIVKVLFVLLLIGLALFGAVMIYRAVSEGSADTVHATISQVSQKSTPSPMPTEEPHQYAYIANVDSGALVFKEPGRSSEVITKIRKGERVEIVEYESDGEWCVICYNDIYAYVQLKYLTLE